MRPIRTLDMNKVYRLTEWDSDKVRYFFPVCTECLFPLKHILFPYLLFWRDLFVIFIVPLLNFSSVPVNHFLASTSVSFSFRRWKSIGDWSVLAEILLIFKAHHFYY